MAEFPSPGTFRGGGGTIGPVPGGYRCTFRDGVRLSDNKC